ncbi:dephospho-CoA kinase [Rhodospirillaceae bacterium SYSU D60014]|uniref:dephospho-CoA kinase n=1 Tax=Virgifigura deserti TaxID=2268457 RepID=UPI000E668898
MVILGLTGSIGMGKTTAAAMLRRCGIPVHDADATVHRLLGARGAAVAAVEASFPGVVRNGAVDRPALARRVFGDPVQLKRLEAILHPLVRRAERRFLARATAAQAPVVVLDVPLLFETGADRRCDATIVVSAPRFLQRARVLRRPDMTPDRLAAIEARQMPDAEKRRRADFVVRTGGDRRATLRALIRIVKVMRRCAGCGCRGDA